MLSRFTDGAWVQLVAAQGIALAGSYDVETGQLNYQSSGSADEQKVGATFGSVYMQGMRRDRYWQGMPERTVYTVPANQTLPAAHRCALQDDYGQYHIFTLPVQLDPGDTITFIYIGGTTSDSSDLQNGYILVKKAGVEMTLDNVKTYPFDAVYHHPANVLSGMIA